MILSKIDNVKPEQQPNNDSTADSLQVAPAIGNTNVVGSAVTVEQFRNALVIIERYNEQIAGRRCRSEKQIGCLVSLSSYGKEVDKDNNDKRKKIKGKVIDWLDWCSTPTFEDGLVTIKWEGISKPETRHISQVMPVG